MLCFNSCESSWFSIQSSMKYWMAIELSVENVGAKSHKSYKTTCYVKWRHWVYRAASVQLTWVMITTTTLSLQLNTAQAAGHWAQVVATQRSSTAGTMFYVTKETVLIRDLWWCSCWAEQRPDTDIIIIISGVWPWGRGQVRARKARKGELRFQENWAGPALGWGRGVSSKRDLIAAKE